ncbi:DUF4198 domain-containing protein [Pseudoxanthomonas winnipegensis]|uniref:DUF4198 domain-containing protein n=1 Tax=Pseudoxanthomonas winnipegensis TaxID=2480810 RepID=A0A4Q8LZN8_9GAMM|nr:DUF4198 domain-containing protein [Pseudoxanthomonas winnipegensis]RZZ86690.1 DUF4198 domain-containing protein [Pseudoxanthomonas winnipegensis]TAA38138.1 DUF4198 domain-containing protein [Pseudoxanthomonas winnipegensis]
MKRSLTLALALAAAVTSFSAAAHKQWLLPSGTTFSGNDPWVSVDAAVSNDLFYFEHVPMRLDDLVITAPDGSTVKPENASTGKYRSVFDVELKQEGTYRIASVSSGLFASYETADGERKRWRGDAANFAAEVPKNAKNLQVSQMASRVETFVTHGAPTATALKPSGVGLELVPVTAPSDLVADEAASFKLVLDGKPAPNVEVTVIRGGTRYRNAQEEIKARTDAQGAFSVTWPDAGMYWLNASSEDDKTSLPQAKQRRLNYVATLEVMPQ